MIQLPIEIGDTILTGKFRNRRVVVKEIGVDQYGHPMVNGKPILKIRIEKLMKGNNMAESAKNSNLELPTHLVHFTIDDGSIVDVYVSDQLQKSIAVNAVPKSAKSIVKKINISNVDQILSQLKRDGRVTGARKYLLSKQDAMKIAKTGKWESKMTKSESKVNTKKLREQAEEGNVHIGKTVPVKIKKEGDRFCIYRIVQPSGKEEQALNRDFGSKEEAERAAKLRGFTLVNDKNEIQEYELDKQPKKLKTAKDKVEYVTEIIRRILRESQGQNKKKISEAEVTDPKLEAKFDELAELERQYTKLKSMVDAFMKEIGYKDIESKYTALAKDDPDVWAYFMEIKKTGDNIIRTKNNIIEVKRAATETETYSHKEAYLTALTKVNAATRKVLEDELNATKTISKRIGAYSSQPNESKLIGESWFGKIKDWFKKFANTLVNRFKSGNKQVEQSIQALEQISAKMR